MAGAAPAFSYNYPERAPERPERPRVRVVPGQGTRTSTQTIPSTVVFMAKTVAVVLVVAALLCFARIALRSATVATSVQSQQLESQIERRPCQRQLPGSAAELAFQPHAREGRGEPPRDGRARERRHHRPGHRRRRHRRGAGTCRFRRACRSPPAPRSSGVAGRPRTLARPGAARAARRARRAPGFAARLEPLAGSPPPQPLLCDRLFVAALCSSGGWCTCRSSWRRPMPRQAEQARTVGFDIEPRRGTIYDRNGTVLAVSVDATTIYANPSEVEDLPGTAAALAGVLGGEAADYQNALSAGTSTFAFVQRKADIAVADQVRALDLKGIYFIADTKRTYPNGRVGAQIVGLTDIDGNGTKRPGEVLRRHPVRRARPLRGRARPRRHAHPRRRARGGACRGRPGHHHIRGHRAAAVRGGPPAGRQGGPHLQRRQLRGHGRRARARSTPPRRCRCSTRPTARTSRPARRSSRWSRTCSSPAPSSSPSRPWPSWSRAP